MKTVKPQRLGIMHRVFEKDGACYFVPTVMVYFAFDAPDVPLHEAALWTAVGASLGQEAVLDEGMWKERGEILMSGKAYPRGGQAATACAPRLVLYSADTEEKKLVDKKLFVVGDRRWTATGPTDPEPFESMPVTWAQAFGGKGYEPNPAGKGAVEIETDEGKKIRPLPNIEDPKKPVASPRDKPEPVGFGAIELTRPSRMKLIGTYDDAWLKEHYPGLAPDLDWLFFNTAPRDQWLPEGYFQGGERFSVEHMHPEKLTVTGAVPRLRARVFFTKKEDPDKALNEVKLTLDTVHLLPNLERGIAFYRGVTKIAEDDAADIGELLLACEARTEPKPLSHYRDVFLKRIDKEKGGLYALRDMDLLPPLPPGADPMGVEDISDLAELVAVEGLYAENLRRKVQKQLAEARQLCLDNDLDPDEHLPQEVPEFDKEEPDLEHLDEYVEQKKAQAEQAKAEAEKQKDAAIEKARALCQEQGIDFDDLVEQARAEDAGPPKFKAEEQLEHLREMQRLAENTGIELPLVEARLQDPDLLEKLKATEAQLVDAYRRYAHCFPEAARLRGDKAEQVRRLVEVACDAGESLAGRDLTGADLRGLVFRDLDLTGVFLEAADLRGADLRGAKLHQAVLARADLSAAKLAGADLREANLGQAKLHETDLSGANLDSATLSGAELFDAVLEGATLNKAFLIGTRIRGGRFAGLKAQQPIFHALDFSRVDLAGAELPDAVFLESTLEEANLAGALLERACLVSTKAARACFDRIRGKSLRVVYQSELPGASFRGADLAGANFRGIELLGACFAEAVLAGADLSEANLEGGDLSRITAPDVLMIRTNLKNAKLPAANLMKGILQKATIEGADFRDSNLFQVDFAKIKGNVATRFDGANMKLIRFVDRGDHGQR